MVCPDFISSGDRWVPWSISRSTSCPERPRQMRKASTFQAAIYAWLAAQGETAFEMQLSWSRYPADPLSPALAASTRRSGSRNHPDSSISGARVSCVVQCLFQGGCGIITAYNHATKNNLLCGVDVRQNWQPSLTHELLGKWQSMAVPELRYTSMRGAYRNDPSPMQIVSGPYGREQVHYEAPPATRVPDEMTRFLDWYNQTSPLNGDKKVPGIARAGIAHLWFEVIHPFDDGNGRVGRAIADHGLSCHGDRGG